MSGTNATDTLHSRGTAARPSNGAAAVNPNQPLWDKALDCFNNGFTSTQAIQAVWQIMPPPGSLTLLATVIGAIYADTYWNIIKLDPTLLAADLHAAIGQNQSDCNKAAGIAFQKWYGLLVRANFGDSGFIPKSDPVTASPDVVVNGQVTLTVQQLISMWNQYDYGPVQGKNNTYGRAQSVNIQVPIHQPVLRMFFSDAGFNPPPQSWIELFTFTGSSSTSAMQGMVAGPIGVGEKCANVDSFSFTPPGDGHYCVIAVAGTEFFTNNPLDQTGNWDTQTWIHSNGAAGWHNVDKSNSNEESLKFYNQDSRPERFVFEAHCANVPEGTKVSLECSDGRLAYPIASGVVKISKGYQVVSTEAELPPNFAGTLKLRYETPNDGLLPEGASIDVRMGWIIPQGHARYFDAAKQTGDLGSYALARPITIGMGNYAFIGGKR